MNFDSEITQYLMDGGQIVARHHSLNTNATTILIRMPKGKWIPNTGFVQDGDEFEYVLGQNSLSVERPHDSEIFCIRHMNHHLRTAKRKAFEAWIWEVNYRKRRAELSAS